MKPRDATVSGIVHLTQNRLRAGLSILGILIGISSVLCMMAIGDGAKLLVADQVDKLGGANQFQFTTRYSIIRRGRRVWTKERFNLGDAHAIEAVCPGVLYVLPKNERYRMLVTSHQGRETRAFLEGVTANYATGMRWHIQTGRFLTENDTNHALQVCVLGSEAATDLFGADSPLGQEVKVRYYWRQVPVRFRVVGVMMPRGLNLRWGWSLDNAMAIPLTTYQERLTGNDYIERLTVFTEPDADMTPIIASARGVLLKRHRNQDDFFRYWIPTGVHSRVARIEKVIKIALGSIAGFSLFVSGIGIMNMCLVSVGEKTREIGLRKSVGARQIHIFWQFLTESICLCFCGGVFGIVGGWFAAHGMARLAVRIVPVVPEWPVVLSGHWILISVIFSIFMGVSFGVYPAMRAARLSPIDALRAEN
ncbi:MAG: ABC transporter permease [Candidatus Poribacteria bacterium]|nr:ABC transporter permease [Candidatus Poribacteria bacterium]